MISRKPVHHRPYEPIAETTPRIAIEVPRLPRAGSLVVSAVRTTRMNESGLFGETGTITYMRRPSHNTSVAMNISAPGMPNATLGPHVTRKSGINIDAKNEPKLMIQ